MGLDTSIEARKTFWTGARAAKEPWAIGHPATDAHHPCGIYGDSARLETSYMPEKITGIFLNLCLFRPKSVRTSRYLLWSCDSKKLFKNRSVNQVLRYVVWSFQYAFVGTHPTFTMGGQPINSDKAGTPLTPGHDCFTVVENRGDWEWHKQVFRFRASWNANLICYRCPALAKGPIDMLYHTTDETASWLRQEFGVAQFCAKRLKDKNLCNFVPGLAQFSLQGAGLALNGLAYVGWMVV